MSIKGDSARAKLAADFFCRNPDKINSPVLRKRITYLKRTEKGKRYMLGTAERIRQEGMAEGFEQGLSQGLEQGRLENAVEIAKNMLHDNIDFMKVSLYSGLPIEQVKELALNI